ncbi:MAG: hypothetical protein JRE21_08970 [Deltaproteobacteria bacterium]|jgi:hypothetical protein|nr:hypothetical protein [Deltaproteobacteria bacterium]
MTGLNKMVVRAKTDYCEESARLAIILAIILVVLAGIPLGLLNKKIADEGSREADVSLYSRLAGMVAGNVNIVRGMLEKGVVDVAALAAAAAPRVTLITPDVSPTNLQEAANQDQSKLDIKLNAIYWNPRDPLVTIDNENYRTGDSVKGFKILEIRETEVVFRSPLGDKVVKYFYDYLD